MVEQIFSLVFGFSEFVIKNKNASFFIIPTPELKEAFLNLAVAQELSFAVESSLQWWE